MSGPELGVEALTGPACSVNKRLSLVRLGLILSGQLFLLSPLFEQGPLAGLAHQFIERDHVEYAYLALTNLDQTLARKAGE